MVTEVDKFDGKGVSKYLKYCAQVIKLQLNIETAIDLKKILKEDFR